MHDESSSLRNTILLVGLSLGIFVADIYTPLGYVSGAPYLIVIALAALSDSPRLTHALAVLCIGLMVVGAWIYPATVASFFVVVINRLILMIVLLITSELAIRNQRMRRIFNNLALHDGLSGLPNRRYFDEQLAVECKRAARDHKPLSLLMIDIDFFKLYNDNLGHQAGDACLIKVAQTIRAELRRPSDMSARYGGEEFAVILPDTDKTSALARAETIRQAITLQTIPHPGDSAEKCVTISVGVATMDGCHRPSPAELIHAADAGLYEAKQRGRNRVGVADHH